jgi:hypothetical protein
VSTKSLSERSVYLSNRFWLKNNVVEYAVIEGGRWKLMASGFVNGFQGGSGPSPGFLLYDVRQDPRERSNVIEQNPADARRLLEDLIVWRHAQPPYDADVSGVVVAEDIEQLRQMGYIGGGESGDDDEPEAPASRPASQPASQPDSRPASQTTTAAAGD